MPHKGRLTVIYTLSAKSWPQRTVPSDTQVFKDCYIRSMELTESHATFCLKIVHFEEFLPQTVDYFTCVGFEGINRENGFL